MKNNDDCIIVISGPTGTLKVDVCKMIGSGESEQEPIITIEFEPALNSNQQSR